jgi:hypothetical protein
LDKVLIRILKVKAEKHYFSSLHGGEGEKSLNVAMKDDWDIVILKCSL